MFFKKTKFQNENGFSIFFGRKTGNNNNIPLFSAELFLSGKRVRWQRKPAIM